jgi:hypothetical protein
MVQVSSALIAIVFAWSAVSKMIRPQSWRTVLQRYRLGAISTATLLLVPVAEALVVALVLMGETRAAGAMSVGMLSAFTLAVVRLRDLEGDRLPCGCFGSNKVRDYRVVLLRNTILGIAAAVMLAGSRDVDLLEGVGVPGGGQIVPALLMVSAVAVAVWLLYSVTRSFKRGIE